MQCNVALFVFSYTEEVYPMTRGRVLPHQSRITRIKDLQDMSGPK